MSYDESVLDDYQEEIDTAVRYVDKRFDQKLSKDDILQEARMLVLSYAGVIKGRLYRKLYNWEHINTDSGKPVRLLYRQLTADLCQIFGRQLNKIHDNPVGIYIEEILTEDVCTQEDSTTAEIALRLELPRLQQEYPYLMMRFDHRTESEMAKHTGVSLSTVRRHLKAEQEKALNDPYLAELLGRGQR